MSPPSRCGRPRLDEQRAQAVALARAADGVPNVKAIAAAVGISDGTVRSALKAAGVRVGRPWSRARRRAYLASKRER